MKLLAEEIQLSADTPDDIDLATRVRVNNEGNGSEATITQKDIEGNVIGSVNLMSTGPTAFVFIDKAPTDTLETDLDDTRFLKVSASGLQ